MDSTLEGILVTKPPKEQGLITGPGFVTEPFTAARAGRRQHKAATDPRSSAKLTGLIRGAGSIRCLQTLDMKEPFTVLRMKGLFF